MKRTLIILAAAAATLLSANASAQVKGQEMEQYRRSSLTMIMLEDSKLDPEIAGLVRQAFIDTPIPSKFNDHTLPDIPKTFYTAGMSVSKEDRIAYNEFAGTKKKTKDTGDGSGGAVAKGVLGALMEVGPSGEYAKWKNPVVDTTKKNAPFYAYKYIMENDLPHKVMDRWFLEGDHLTIKTLMERAAYNATESDKVAASENADGSAGMAMDYILNNGGWDLVSNSFVTISSFRYYNADEMYFEIMNGAAIGAQYLPEGLANLTMSTADMAATSAMLSIGKGYSIYTTTYLYRIVWNEETKLAVLQGAMDINRFKEYPFTLEYVGEETANAIVARKDKTLEEAVAFATQRALDKVIAKLERKYEVFRTKTPLLSLDPTTAGIGNKECVEKGDKYDVLSVSMGKNGESIYKTVGTIKVETVGNTLGEVEYDAEGNPIETAERTTFTGKLPKSAHPGTLIRQSSKK